MTKLHIHYVKTTQVYSMIKHHERVIHLDLLTNIIVYKTKQKLQSLQNKQSYAKKRTKSTNIQSNKKENEATK